MGCLDAGLVSVTFRSLSPEKIISLVQMAGLRGVEWGGDVHVPAGDLKKAREVGRWTREAGLTCVAYGSYYRVGVSESEALPFEAILDTARALNTSCVRVWAGDRSDKEADEAFRNWVSDELQRIVLVARAGGVRVALEFREGTLNDSAEAARRLVDSIQGEACRSLWQQKAELTIAENHRELLGVLPHLEHLHVFHCGERRSNRLPLVEGAESWQQYLKTAAESSRRVFALLEFVCGDEPEQFLNDAAALKGWVSEVGAA